MTKRIGSIVDASYKVIKYGFFVIIVYLILSTFIESSIKSGSIGNSHLIYYPIFKVSEVMIDSVRGKRKVVSPFLGVFQTTSDTGDNIYYQNILDGRFDTHQALIYDNPEKTGIRYICDPQSGEVLYCGCVSEESRWCMVHIQF